MTRERVIHVHHWTEKLFSFRTTRGAGLRFRNGQFVMVGLEIAGRPLMRAYSIASANYEEFLEFFSIKVPEGPLTSRLQHVAPGDEVLSGNKPVGTLVLDDLKPGTRLFLLCTGTGLAPFLSLIKDLELYERFDKIVLVHSVREVRELAYADHIEHVLPADELLGGKVRQQLVYYPTVTREPFRHNGRLTWLIESGALCRELKLPPLSAVSDRVMLCGNTSMLRDARMLLDARGFLASPRQGVAGDYVFERAFVEQ